MDLTANGTTHAVDVEEDTPLLWVIRDRNQIRSRDRTMWGVHGYRGRLRDTLMPDPGLRRHRI